MYHKIHTEAYTETKADFKQNNKISSLKNKERERQCFKNFMNLIHKVYLKFKIANLQITSLFPLMYGKNHEQNKFFTVFYT